MPIRPENKDRYPKDWRSISVSIRERAGGQCECEGTCGLRHYLNEDGKQIDLTPDLQIDLCPPSRCTARNGEPHPVTDSIVVLTVAHLDHQPENCDPENLRAWCQRCHNRYDAAERRRGIQERSKAKRALGDLFV